jgi:hypothetical protein
MVSPETIDRGRCTRRKTLHRPERQMFGHVLRISPQDAQHRRSLEDRDVCVDLGRSVGRVVSVVTSQGDVPSTWRSVLDDHP